MSEQDKQLMKGETFLFKAKPHWVVFLPAIFWLILAFLVFTIGNNYTAGYIRILQSAPLYKLGSWFCFIVSFLYAIRGYVEWQFTEYAVTNKRVLVKLGCLRRDTLEILIQKVEGIKVEQSLLARLLNYGSVIVSGVGGSRDPFIHVPNPSRFRQKVQTLLDNS